MTLNFLLYLLYGLAFFTLGVAILSRDITISELGIARIIRLLAIFGIIHGFHEWLELLEQLDPSIKSPLFVQFRLAVVSLSFLFLLYFGIFINIITYYGDRALETTPQTIKLLVGLFVLSLLFFAAYLDLGTGKDLNTRLFIAFPGGLLSGIGLIIYSRTVRSFSQDVAINFILAGIFMIGYAILTGVTPSHVIVPFFDIKVVFFRGMCAFLIMFFTIRALSVFNLEQQKLINEQLLRFSQSEKLTSMGILAAGIAHEINNPLTNVSLNVEMLKDMVKKDDKINKKIMAIERNVDRASQIAKELLHFSREKETDVEPVDINQIIASTKSLLKNQKNSSIIQLSLNYVPTIMGIPWKLEEVFVNLLLNSLDACQKEDSITVETLFEKGRVIAEITDTGHGISQDNLSKVFDPFFTTKEVGKGTGLGLSVCYNIVQQHGGELSLLSSENGGTIVTLTFPVTTNGK